eukprot:gene5077-6181_t
MAPRLAASRSPQLLIDTAHFQLSVGIKAKEPGALVNKQVFGNAASANDGDMVSQLSLLGKSTDRHTSVGGQEGARRKILQSEENSRDAKIWMSTFMAISVGFFLTVLLLISICCMFDMDVKEDTLLYGNSKKDS